MSAGEERTQECFRLWRIRRTILQMLLDRGYNVPNEDLNMTVDEFYEKMATIPSEPKSPIK